MSSRLRTTLVGVTLLLATAVTTPILATPALAAPALPSAAPAATAPVAAPVSPAAKPAIASATLVAGPVRKDSYRPTYFIHGFDALGRGKDCVKYWGDEIPSIKHIVKEVVTWGYYKGDKNCTRKYNGSAKTDIHTLSRALAWDIYNNYTKKGKIVDVVGHSMGGLIIRDALAMVYLDNSLYPPKLYVEDVVTIATPHAGAPKAKFCPKIVSKQCEQMRTGSTFLRDLLPSPQSYIGTDWTLIGSEDDKIVPKSSSIYGMAKAGHLRWYSKGKKLGHTEIQKKISSGFSHVYWNYYSDTKHSNTATWERMDLGTGGAITMPLFYWWKW